MAWAKRLIRKCFGLCLYRLTSCVLIIWLDLAYLMLAWKGLGKRGGSSCGAVEKKNDFKENPKSDQDLGLESVNKNR